MDPDIGKSAQDGALKFPQFFPEGVEVSWETVHGWQMENLDFQLVDIREAWEREAGHAGGLWIPLGDLHGRIGELQRGVPVAFYCRKGIRSLIAVQRFGMRLGGVPVYSVAGGLEGKGA